MRAKFTTEEEKKLKKHVEEYMNLNVFGPWFDVHGDEYFPGKSYGSVYAKANKLLGELGNQYDIAKA
jgi:hypothetical protein